MGGPGDMWNWGLFRRVFDAFVGNALDSTMDLTSGSLYGFIIIRPSLARWRCSPVAMTTGRCPLRTALRDPVNDRAWLTTSAPSSHCLCCPWQHSCVPNYVNLGWWWDAGYCLSSCWSSGTDQWVPALITHHGCHHHHRMSFCVNASYFRWCLPS